ncbi:5-bromo-4-chloroindolyl phosphate hydrolysis family protein [Enterococcus hirae]|nr:5-bromo-4-chloroindolyl phosphate hydrolysis family protein [Enterococcus hirae]
MKNIFRWFQHLFSVIALLFLILFVIGFTNSAPPERNIALALFFLGAVILRRYLKIRALRSEPAVFPKLTSSKEEHYRACGMNESEIEFFRKTMASAKEQITALENNVQQANKLKAINLRTEMLPLSKKIFKELVQDPLKLHLANHFLYTHLPNLVDLTAKYLEINEHSLKNKETFAKLEESEQIIEQLAGLIQRDYQTLTQDELEDMDVELEVAKSNLESKEHPQS